MPLAAGADNLRDPFNPVGRADPFETTSLLVVAAHLRPDEALAAVTTGARTLLGLDDGPGDWVRVPAHDLDDPLGDAIAGAADARIVLHRGRVVADSRIRPHRRPPRGDPRMTAPRLPCRPWTASRSGSPPARSRSPRCR